MKLATRNRFGNWTVEVVDAAEPSGQAMPFLAYDNLGNAHIAYTAAGTLKYAKRKD